jgi:hypothetical protein
VRSWRCQEISASAGCTALPSPPASLYDEHEPALPSLPPAIHVAFAHSVGREHCSLPAYGPQGWHLQVCLERHLILRCRHLPLIDPRCRPAALQLIVFLRPRSFKARRQRTHRIFPWFFPQTECLVPPQPRARAQARSTGSSVLLGSHQPHHSLDRLPVNCGTMLRVPARRQTTVALSSSGRKCKRRSQMWSFLP